MKIQKKFQIVFFVCIVICMIVKCNVVAWATSREANIFHVTQEDIKSFGVSEAIQKALNQAKYNSSEDNQITVQVEAGKYELDRVLCIYSG